MNEVQEKKSRDLKLKIARLEKELKQSQHTMNLQGWLRAGHAGQISRAAEKDKQRIDEKLSALRAELGALEAGSDSGTT